MNQSAYALCRAVADGWLVLDRGTYQGMDDARESVKYRDRCGEDRYVVMATDVAAGEIAGADGLPLEDSPPLDEDDEMGVLAEAIQDEFATYMREQTAAPPRQPHKARPDRDGAKQLMLLSHLSDKPGQLEMFEEGQYHV